MNVLFVCSRNQWRSPTAEWLYRKEPGVAVRSAGTSPRARRSVTERDVLWADVIVVMESKHRDRLQASHRRSLGRKPLHVLEIPDEYGFKDPDLIEILQAAVDPILADRGQGR